MSDSGATSELVYVLGMRTEKWKASFRYVWAEADERCAANSATARSTRINAKAMAYLRAACMKLGIFIKAVLK